MSNHLKSFFESIIKRKEKPVELELIFPKRNSNTSIKTRVKVTSNELNDAETRLYLKLKGVDLDNPNKVSSRYTYFIVDGDLINKKK